MNKSEGDMMTGTYEGIPVEDLRFTELPPEIADIPEFEEDPVADRMVTLMGQMLQDIEELTVHLEGAHVLMSLIHTTLIASNEPEYPATEMFKFLLRVEALLAKIAETYVPEPVDTEPEKG